MRVVVTLRAELLRPAVDVSGFRTTGGEAHSAIVLPLTADELEQAIRTPAERVGAVLEKGLVGAISADVAEQPGALPLLQYALTELFERREGRMLTGETYHGYWGCAGSVGTPGGGGVWESGSRWKGQHPAAVPHDWSPWEKVRRIPGRRVLRTELGRVDR